MIGHEITHEYFEVAHIISQFLETFKEATELLSGQYYLITHRIIPTLYSISFVFKKYMEHPRFTEVMLAMIDKFMKYYDDIPLLYSIALYLDPCIKVSGSETLIENFYTFLDPNEPENLSFETITRIQTCKDILSVNLSNIYHMYEIEYFVGTLTTTGRDGSSSFSSAPIITSSG